MAQDTQMEGERDPAALLQRLKGFQIFFILISVIVGSGVFSNNGQALEVAGPMGLIMCVIIQGLIAAFVGESVSELVQMFPAPNALYVYVAEFVDEDLGWIASVAHWYCFASVFPAQMVGAYKLLQYWQNTANNLKTIGGIVFYGIVPWALFALNLCGVDYFGWVETIGGALKLAMVFAITCVLYNVHQTRDSSIPEPISAGLEHQEDVAANPFTAFCFAVPPVAYAYLGVESTAIAAYEAKTTRSIARASQSIHWVVVLVYFLCTLGIVLTLDWQDANLPLIWGTDDVGNVGNSKPTNPESSSATIIAIWNKNRGLADVANACLIFSILSSANTCLYIASRTMYGVTYHLRGTNPFSRYFKRTVGKVWTPTKVPAMALFISALLFYWLPFLTLIGDGGNVGADTVIEIVTLTASISCIITWSLLLIAYIRYERWTRLCAKDLTEQNMTRFIRDSEEYKAFNVLSWLQPWAARIALAGCLFIFVCLSATMWWPSHSSFPKIAAAYGAHIILFILWVVLKLYRYYIKEERPLRLWVPMEADPKARGGLIERLRRLERLSAKGQDRYKPRLSQSNGILAAPDVGDEPIATGEMNGHHSTAIANPPQ